MKKAINYGVWILCLTVLFISCKKQDHYYKEFIKDGEIVYVGKADSVVFHPGQNRALLTWKMKDPNISKIKVYWNTGKDSLVFDVNRTNQIDSIGIIIDNLDERFYSFEIYSEDIEKNRSVKVLAEGQVYGSEYNSALLNRVIRNTQQEDGNLIINWFDPSTTMIGSEIRYVDNEGKISSTYVPITSNQNILEGVNFNELITYRTLFLPDTLSIDTFYTEFESIIIN